MSDDTSPVILRHDIGSIPSIIKDHVFGRVYTRAMTTETDSSNIPVMLRDDLKDIPSYVAGANLAHTIKLSSNELTYGPLPSVQEAIAEAGAHGNRYPDMGVMELRTKLAQHLGMTVDEIAVGCGSSAICQQLVQITCEQGEEVIFPWPSFEAYPLFAQVAGAEPIMVPLTEDGYNDLPAMLAAITDKTRLIFVCNPNNPTGTLVTKQQFKDFIEAVPSNILVALDEAYIEFVREEDTPNAQEIVKDYPNVVGLRTFSKAYGLAGIRAGYAFGNPVIIDALNKVALPFGVSVVAQAAASASLDAQDELLARTDEVVRNRKRISDKLGVAPSQANFVWIPTETPEKAEEIAEKIAKHNITVRVFPNGEGVRITVTNDEETDKLLDALDVEFGA